MCRCMKVGRVFGRVFPVSVVCSLKGKRRPEKIFFDSYLITKRYFLVVR